MSDTLTYADQTVDAVDQYRAVHYTPFSTELTEIGNLVTRADPSQWWLLSYLHIRRLEEALKRNCLNSEELENFITVFFPDVKRTLLDARLTKETDHALATHDVTHHLSDQFIGEYEKEEVRIHQVSIEKLSECTDIRFEEDVQRDLITVGIYSKKRNEWFYYPIPKQEEGFSLLHKGGLARVILKIYAGAPIETVEAELPLNDIDFIGSGERNRIFDTAIKCGGDVEGIELLKEIDLADIFQNRDLDLNGCVLSSEGLFFSEEAFYAARTGRIAIMANKRGIYGSEVFYYDGLRLIKNRGIMRLLKTIAEEKAVSFEYLPINEKVDLGIYWLVLARKFCTKPNAGILFDRLFYLGKKTGNVRPKEKNIFEVLDRVHSELSFYDFHGSKFDNIGLARWLVRKLTKQIDKFYRDRYKIPTSFDFERKPGDTIPYEVNLNDYTPNNVLIENFDSLLEQFLCRSKERTHAYRQRELNGSAEV